MSERSERIPAYYTVPAGKQPKPCKSAPACDAMIYLVKSPTKAGVWIPVDCDPSRVQHGSLPTATEHGRGINHFETCKEPNRHRRPRQVPAPTQSGPAEQRELVTENHRPPICIFCGCSSRARCTIPKSALDPVEQDIQVGRLDLLGPADLPETVHCYFLQIEPPVCSNPECKSKRASELPLRMRVGNGDRS